MGTVNISVTAFIFDYSFLLQFMGALITLPSIYFPLSAVLIYYYGFIGLMVPLLVVIMVGLMFYFSKYNSLMSTRSNECASVLN